MPFSLIVQNYQSILQFNKIYPHNILLQSAFNKNNIDTKSEANNYEKKSTSSNVQRGKFLYKQ